MTETDESITAEPLEGDALGTIYRPSESDPAPGVLLLHGSGGEPMDRAAKRLAEEGFVSAAIQYFGAADGVPDDLEEVPLERVEEAIDTLREHERVVGDRVGLYGVSKGAELALLAATRVDGVGAVASVAGSCYVREGLTAEWGATGGSSWSYDGEPVTYVPFADGQPPGNTIRSNYEFALERADAETVEAATIPVERIDAPILFVSGGDDRMWSSATYAETAIDRLERHEFEHEVDHLHVEEAGHTIRPPGPWLEELDEGSLRFTGGTPEGTAEASEAYWPEVLALLESSLGE